MGQKVFILNHEQMKEKFPYLATSEDRIGTYQEVNAGYISPRKMVKVQKLLAGQGGCDIINDIVKRISPIGSAWYEIEAEKSGHVIRGKKVLVATGCFTHSRDLLPKGLELKILPAGITSLYVREIYSNNQHSQHLS